MNTDNIKTEYTIILHEPLDDVEKARLQRVESMCGFKQVEYEGCYIRCRTDAEDQEAFRWIAGWLTHIGAEESIFCIQKTMTFYTGFVSPEVKQLMRT